VLEEIQSAVDRAEEEMKHPGDPLLMFEHAYAEMPVHLKEQREEFIRFMAERKEEGRNG